MENEGLRPPLIRQGWLRVMLFVSVYILVLYGTSLALSSLAMEMRPEMISKGQPALVRELLGGDLLWLTAAAALTVSLITVLVCRKLIDRKDLVSLGFRLAGHSSDAAIGISLAVAILGIGSLILYFSGHLQWIDLEFNPNNLFIQFGILLLVACSEEIVFRGYILSNLQESFNRWVALAISALLFCLFHLSNQGMGLIPFINIFLAGILLGINYIFTKNLWYALLFHLGWNFFQGPILGFRISGFHLPTLLQSSLNGDQLLTGGEFGFEGSIIDTAISLIAILLLYLAYERKFRPALPRGNAEAVN